MADVVCVLCLSLLIYEEWMVGYVAIVVMLAPNHAPIYGALLGPNHAPIYGAFLCLAVIKVTSKASRFWLVFFGKNEKWRRFANATLYQLSYDPNREAHG